MFINFPVKINRKKLKKNNHKTTKTQKEQKASCLVVSPGFTKNPTIELGIDAPTSFALSFTYLTCLIAAEVICLGSMPTVRML